MKKGVSPLIASVLTIMFGIMMIVIVLTVIRPTLDRTEDSAKTTEIVQNLQLIGNIVKDVASEAEGSRRTVSMTVSDGYYYMDIVKEWVYAEYEPNVETSYRGKTGDVYVDRGLVAAEFFNHKSNGTNDAPFWYNITGSCQISNSKFLCDDGTYYMNVTPVPVRMLEFVGKTQNLSGSSGGQILLVPVNPESVAGFWPFDQGAGYYAYDYMSSGRDAGLNNMDMPGTHTSGWQADNHCVAGTGCVLLDGLDDYLNISHFELGSTWTISVWVKRKGLVGDQYIISKSGQVKDIYISSNNKLVVNPSVDQAVTSIGTIEDVSNWHNIIATSDGSIVSIYIDGKLDGSASRTVGISSGDWRIGERIDDGCCNFNGYIDELHIFNVSMTKQEAESFYYMSKGKVSGSEESLIEGFVIPYVIVGSPNGQSTFDDIRIRKADTKNTFIIPFDGVDLNGTLQITAGTHSIMAIHRGANTTSNKPVIELIAS